MQFHILLGCLVSSLACANAQFTTASTLNITALTGRNNVSVLECWQLAAELEPATIPGRIGTLALPIGNFSNAVYGVLPPRFVGGLHNAPKKQYVWWISGLVHFTLPNVTEGVPTEAVIHGGKYGLIFAEDTADVSTYGHGTNYPSADITISMSLPVEDGVTPAHTVLHDGPCLIDDISGL